MIELVRWRVKSTRPQNFAPLVLAIASLNLMFLRASQLSLLNRIKRDLSQFRCMLFMTTACSCAPLVCYTEVLFCLILRKDHSCRLKIGCVCHFRRTTWTQSVRCGCSLASS